MMAFVIGAALPETEHGVQRRFIPGQSQPVDRNSSKCESRADLKVARLAEIHWRLGPYTTKLTFPRDAVPDPEKQRLSPATSLFLASHCYRMVSEHLTKYEFGRF
jgi:hypothetical protein